MGNGLFLSSGDDSIQILHKAPKERKDRNIRLEDGDTLQLATVDFRSTVWHVRRDSTGMHPTEKPPALAMIAIANSTQPDDVVLDNFGRIRNHDGSLPAHRTPVYEFRIL